MLLSCNDTSVSYGINHSIRIAAAFLQNQIVMYFSASVCKGKL